MKTYSFLEVLEIIHQCETTDELKEAIDALAVVNEGTFADCQVDYIISQARLQVMRIRFFKQFRKE